ncbi:MAG: polyphosphate polymerase domain-containing protein [Planctomycetes bacterium]|nr:polyphosphate polymerase domain-containing protein [Planctomycetota bacterium]
MRQAIEVPDMLSGPAIIESPALCKTADETPAFEVKFVQDEEGARQIEDRLRERMTLDPHADPALGNAYRVTSIYFDTPRFDVYHRSEGYRARKFRLRRYGDMSSVFLEQKSKRNQQVKKRRTSVALNELAELHGTIRDEWPGSWFARKLAMWKLAPVCQVSYERVAYIGTSSLGPIRLTFDRAAHGASAAGIHLEPPATATPLLNGEVIVEFKFLGTMPILFKEVIEALRLTPRAASKYRRCVEAIGLFNFRGEACLSGSADPSNPANLSPSI